MLGNAVSTALPFCFEWEVRSVFFHTQTFTRQQYFKTEKKSPSPLEDFHELCTFVVKTHHPLPQPLRRVLRLPT